VTLKEQILAAQDLERVAVEVPEWSCKVWLRTMSGAERDQVDKELVKAADGDTAWLQRMLLRVMSDEEGARVFADADLPAVMAKSGKVLRRLIDQAAKINGYGVAEETEKN
jgi:hypothetical protein